MRGSGVGMRLVIVVCMSVVLTGCVGPAPIPSGSASAPTAGTVEGSESRGILDSINAERAASSAPALREDSGLSAEAVVLLEDWVSGVELSEDDVRNRIALLGYGGWFLSRAEGVTQERATELILGDDGVKASLLDPEFRAVGVGTAIDDDGRVRIAVLLGYRADDSSLPLYSEGAAEALVLTNDERARFGLPALLLSDDLSRAAQGQADHQAAILEMTHDGNGGLGNRLSEVGYTTGAENVAVGQRSIAQVVQGWIDSPGHHANIVNDRMTEMGFAVAVGRDGQPYFAQVFGTR